MTISSGGNSSFSGAWKPMKQFWAASRASSTVPPRVEQATATLHFLKFRVDGRPVCAVDVSKRLSSMTEAASLPADGSYGVCPFLWVRRMGQEEFCALLNKPLYRPEPNGFLPVNEKCPLHFPSTETAAYSNKDDDEAVCEVDY